MDADEEVDVEVEIDPLAPLVLGEQNRVVADAHRRRFVGLVPVNRDRQPHVLARFELGDLHLVGVARRGQRRVRAQFAELLLHDRVRRTDQLGLRVVAVEDEPLEDAAEFGVPLLVAAQVRSEVIERPHRPADVGEREAGKQLAVRHVFRRERHRHCQHAGADAGLARGDPERRAAANRLHDRFRDRNVVEDEARRFEMDHAEVGQVRSRVADKKVVDVVLAGVHAGGE